MLTKIDKQTLKAMGVDDPDRLLSAIAQALRERTSLGSPHANKGLIESEEAFLGTGGANGAGVSGKPDLPDHDRGKWLNALVEMGQGFAQLLGQALTPQDVASLRKVTPSRIRQRMDANQL